MGRNRFEGDRMNENLLPKYCRFSLCGSELVKIAEANQVLNGGVQTILRCPKCKEFVDHYSEEWK
jgi:putative component of membrane protein insertase Oxa1/YidC/SpoIIIJ protein YidD